MGRFDKSWMMLALSAAIAVGSVSAQPRDEQPAATEREDAKPVTARLSVQEMKTRSVGMQIAAQDDYRHLVTLQTRARKAKDVIKLNCINDKLVQFKAQMNILDGSMLRLTAALERDTDERHTVYAEVNASRESLKKIRGEADLCAGAELIGPDSVTLVDRPEFPDDPTTWDPAWEPDTVSEVDPPAYASPFN